MFDGAFKARTQVSLRGNSRNTNNKAELLQQTQQARQQRELQRQQQRASERINKFVIARSACRRVSAQQRQSWQLPQHSASQTDWTNAVRQLLLFYNERSDKGKFQLLAQALVQPPLKLSFDEHVYLAQRLAKIALQQLYSDLDRESDPNVRMLFFGLLGAIPQPIPWQSRATQIAVIRSLINGNALAQKVKTSGSSVSEITAALLMASTIALEDADATTSNVIAETLAQHGLTLPLLEQTMPQFDEFASKLPLDRLLPIWLTKEKLFLSWVGDPARIVAVVTNLVCLTRKRTLEYFDLLNYAQLLSRLVPHLPSNSFSTASSQRTVADDADDDDDMEVDQRQASNTLIIDPKLTTILRLLVGHAHLSQLRRLFAQTQNISNELYIRGIIAGCSLYTSLCMRWPSQSFEILNALVFNDWVQWVGTLWQLLRTHHVWQVLVAQNTNSDALLNDSSESSKLFWSVCGLFILCFNHVLITLGDDEFHQDQGSWVNGLSMRELTFAMKSLVWCLIRNDSFAYDTLTVAGTEMTFTHLKTASIKLLRQLHDRHCRRPYMPDSQWLASVEFTPQSITPTLIEAVARWGDPQVAELRAGPDSKKIESILLLLLKNVPFMLPFETRVHVFRQFIRLDSPESFPFSGNHVTIRRDHIFEDGFNKINPIGKNLRKRIQIQFIDEMGLPEAGVDGGGVFKEFVTGLTKEAFDPERGLFSTTTANMLFPNPHSHLLDPEAIAHFSFLGRMLGKMLLEGILLEVPFAGFFLNKLLGRTNYVDDLPSLDQSLYQNLIFLKHYKGNVEDLALDFTVTDNELGVPRVIELAEGGKSKAVTSENRIYYIHLVAYYRLNSQIHRASSALLSGIEDIFDPSILRIFNPGELQTLIGGVSSPIDLDDMEQHTTYAGGFSPRHPTIVLFWKVVRSLSEEHRRLLLRFVTSCSRPPLMGFAEINPPLCVHAVSQVDRLPTASTCFNLLKLPVYDTERVLREKLLYAIESNSGFDLS